MQRTNQETTSPLRHGPCLGPTSGCAAAWFAAVDYLGIGGEAYNVLMTIENPVAYDGAEGDAICHVDRLLHRGGTSVSTVANTIFPQDLYRRHGREGLYEAALEAHENIRKGDWGRYFSRLICMPTVIGGKLVERHNRLEELIGQVGKFAERRASCGSAPKHALELDVPPHWATPQITVHDAGCDRRRGRGGPCLSHLSFKLHPDHGLMLTAIYRNHYYIERLLGNLIGLGRLMRFVADSAGVEKVGPLTCLSTHAEVEADSRWGGKETVRQVVEDVRSTLGTPKATE